jgi:hypothetical protein
MSSKSKNSDKYGVYVLKRKDDWDGLKENEYKRLRAQQITQRNPVIDAMGELHDEMRNVLSNNDLSSSDVVRLFNEALLKYKNFERNMGSSNGGVTAVPPVAAPPVAAPAAPVAAVAAAAEPAAAAAVVAAPVVKEPPVEAVPDVIQESKPDLKAWSIDKRFGKDVTSLLDHFKDHPNLISSNPDGELVIKGEVIPHSSFKDMVKFLVSPGRKALNTEGKGEFFKALHESKIPSTLIRSTKSRSEYIKSFIKGEPMQKGKGKPPGTRPRVLYVYPPVTKRVKFT